MKTVIKEYKIRQATKQLLELGFPDWLSVTAVRACGTDVDRCCEWLASGQSPVEASIDISQELARISKYVLPLLLDGLLAQIRTSLSLRHIVRVRTGSQHLPPQLAAVVSTCYAILFQLHFQSFVPSTCSPAPSTLCRWVYIGNLSQDVVEIALISCSGDVNATETVLKSNFEHFAEHGSEAFASDPPPKLPPSNPGQNSWSDDLFPLHWGGAEAAQTQTVAQPPGAAKKDQVAPGPKQAKPASTSNSAATPAKPESPAFQFPDAVLKAANESFITDLSRYNELLGISEEDESDEEWTDEEEEEETPEQIENQDPAALWNEYHRGANSTFGKQEVEPPPTPPPTQGR